MNEPHGTPRGGYHGLEIQRGLVASFSSAAFSEASTSVATHSSANWSVLMRQSSDDLEHGRFPRHDVQTGHRGTRSVNRTGNATAPRPAGHAAHTRR